MGNLATLMVRIGADISELEKGLSKVSRQVEDTGKRMEQMGKTLTTRVTAPLAALAGVAVRSFGIQEKAELQLRAALQANGRQVETLFGQYNEFAQEMQRVTVVGDETTLAMLAQAESLGITGDAAQRAVRNSIAMQSAFGVNAQSALRYTAALEEGNATMLTRYIPALRDITDDAERAAKAQEILGNAFSSAEAEAQGSTGQIIQMKNAVGDLMEQVGEIISEAIMPMVSRLKSVAEALQEVDRAVLANAVKWGAIFAAIGPVLLIGGKLVSWTGQAIGILARLSTTVIRLSRVFGLLLSPIFAKIAAIAALVLIGKSIWDTFEPLQNFFIRLWDAIANAFESAINFIIRGWNKVKEVISNVVPGITATVVESVSWMNDQTEGKLGEFADNVRKNFNDAIQFAKDLGASIVEAGKDFFGFGEDVEKATSSVSNSVGQMSRDWDEAISRMGVSGGTFEPVSVSAKKMAVDVSEASRATADMMEYTRYQVQRVQNTLAIATQFANTFTDSFGQGLTNVFMESQKVIEAIKNIARLLMSSAIQTGIRLLLMGTTGGIAGGAGFLGGGGLFGRLFNVNDAMITSGGDVVKFHPDDNILAMKDFSSLGGGGLSEGALISVLNKINWRIQGQDIVASYDNSRRMFG